MKPQDKVKTIDCYFQKVDAKDQSFIDLFTEDVEVFFPKFGKARGKTALKELFRKLSTAIEQIDHHMESFNYTISNDTVIVEGTEEGVMSDGTYWPNGSISEGRFCSVFEFDGTLIKRMYIYVDPDYASLDQGRIHTFGRR